MKHGLSRRSRYHADLLGDDDRKKNDRKRLIEARLILMSDLGVGAVIEVANVDEVEDGDKIGNEAEVVVEEEEGEVVRMQ